MKIGVIGNGFVGGAVINGFSTQFNVLYYDVDSKKSKNSLEEVVTQSEVIFLCVPTPQKAGGEVELMFINNVFDKIIKTYKEAQHGDYDSKIFVIKSTVPPGTCDELAKRSGLNVLSNPEFLTERFANEEFMRPRLVLIGASEEKYALKLKSAYEAIYSPLEQAEVGAIPDVTYKIVSTKESETVKYVTNVFFSLKVSFMNMIYSFCKEEGMDYEKIVECFVADGRVYNEHLSVPGPDGKLGFGGKCFPKDLIGLTQVLRLKGVDVSILDSVYMYNERIREDSRWDNL